MGVMHTAWNASMARLDQLSQFSFIAFDWRATIAMLLPKRILMHRFIRIGIEMGIVRLLDARNQRRL